MTRFRQVPEPSIIVPLTSTSDSTARKPKTFTGAVGAACMLPLRGIINHMRKAGSLWFPTGIELAEYCLNNVFQAETQNLRATAG